MSVINHINVFADNIIDSVKGDVNADNEFNVADVVVFQKWLLGYDVDLKNWKNADLCEDNELDVFDLCFMKRELISKLTPIAPPTTQPVSFENIGELINEVTEYNLNKYPENARDGLSKMYDTIKKYDSIYEVNSNDSFDIDADHNIFVVPYTQYEDLGIYSYTKNDYQIIVYYADNNIDTNEINDYLMQRFNQQILKKTYVNEQEVSITEFGIADDTHRICASAFIDDSHYYTVRSAVNGTEEELIAFLENVTFDKITFNNNEEQKILATPPMYDTYDCKSYGELYEWLCSDNDENIERYGKQYLTFKKAMESGKVPLMIPAFNGTPAEIKGAADWQNIMIFTNELYNLPWIWYYCNYNGRCIVVGISYLDYLSQLGIIVPQNVNSFVESIEKNTPNPSNKEKYLDIYNDIYYGTLTTANGEVKTAVYDFKEGRTHYRFITNGCILSVWDYSGEKIEDEFWKKFTLKEFSFKD